MSRRLFLFAVFAIVLLAACDTPTPQATGVAEQAVVEIPLDGPVSRASAEVSGLAWYDDILVLLPQYPTFSRAKGDGVLFALSKADVLAFLDGETAEPLTPRPISFSAPGLARQIDGFEGYEAIAFDGERVYLTIEASTRGGMRGYLVAGQIAPDLSALEVDVSAVVEILPQSGSPNKSDEAILPVGDQVLTFYEVNGAGLNDEPVAHRFDADLTPAGTVPFLQIEYRLTDVTALDAAGRFWAINYFFPGDTDLKPRTDPLAELYGEGPTHASYEPVERLLEFEYDPAGIRLVDQPPIQLELLAGDARNWEGLVRLDDRGFLLVTDKFPETILGFVAWPEE